MRVVQNLQELAEPLEASVVTIGNFDGVHLGHQRLLRRVVEVARAQRATAAAITLEPHPLKLLAPARAPKLLTPFAKKLQLIEATGIDLLIVLAFTQELAHYSPQEFVRQILRGPLRAVAVLVGPSFRFGYRQSGDAEVLREFARPEGFSVEVVPMLRVRGQGVSSSRIRHLLAAGSVHRACRLLGRPFSLSGPIVAGSGVGRAQTVPTLNLGPLEEQVPGTGVYITRTRLKDGVHDSVSNVGHKPTFGHHRLTVESYLLNLSGQVREDEMEIEFLYRLRDEMKFPSPAALKAQIQKDARRSQKFFNLVRLFQRHPTRQFGSGHGSAT